ncbi:MAG: class I SAM-dependent methyltransferase [Armatimonadetes bacterium]|nr:class I SAM-dependent methyltransferase [Armatimonadota bacterium]
MTPESGCNLCGSTRRVHLFEKFRFPIVACRDCGLHCLERMPSAAEVNAWYDEGYFTGDPERRGYLNYLEDRETLVATFDLKLQRLEDLLGPSQKPRRILDVGTATGFFLEAAERRGWVGCGTEVSEYAWKQAVQRGLSVVHGDSLEPFRGQKFDVVTLWDVLEHLRDPRGYLTRAQELLSDDGILAFSTGDVANIWSRLQGKRNRIYNPPQHLYYFSRATMIEISRRAGLEVVRIEPDEKITTLHYVLHIARNLVDLPLVAEVVGRAMRFIPDRTLHMKLSDNLVVYARRATPKPRGTSPRPALESAAP